MLTLLLAFTCHFDKANANTFKEVKVTDSSTKVYEKPAANAKEIGTMEKGLLLS